MNKKESVFRLLGVVVGIGLMIAAVIGMFYSTNGERFTTANVYGDSIEIYGDGIYAFNSVLAVANRLGADLTGIILAVVLIISTLWKKRTLLVDVIQTSVLIYITYNLASLVLGVSMNSLYFLYVICFGISLFITIKCIQDLLKGIEVSESMKNKRLTGTGIFLIIIGVVTALLWSSSIIPAMLNNTYGSLLGIQTTEVTYGIDLSITCPAYIMCGIWLLKKRSVGYKVAPLLLNMMVGTGILVLSQRAYCTKLGINIPIGALFGFIISFVVMGIISLYFVSKLMRGLKKI